MIRWSGTGPPPGYQLPPTWDPSQGPPPGWDPAWGYPSWEPDPPAAAGGGSGRRGFGATVAERFEIGPVSVSIVAVTIAVWLVHLALSTWGAVNTDLSLGDNGAGIHGQPWRLVTAMVVHFGILHIGLNMLMLWQIGPAVERVIGHRTFLVSYLACGIAGSALSDVALGQAALSGGASGAIVGLVGILVGNTAGLAWVERGGRQSRQRWRFNPSIARSIGLQIVAWIVFSSLAIPQIDNWAHVGGGVLGLVIGFGVAVQSTVPTDGSVA